KAGIQLFEAAFGANDARFAQPTFGHEDLPIQIAQFEAAGVRQDQSSHTSRRQLVGSRTSHSTDARDEHRRALKFSLPSLAEVRTPHLPLIDGLLNSGEAF